MIAKDDQGLFKVRTLLRQRWFDWLTTNGKGTRPFVLSLSKDLRADFEKALKDHAFFGLPHLVSVIVDTYKGEHVVRSTTAGRPARRRMNGLRV